MCPDILGKIGTPKLITIIVLKMEQFGIAMKYCIYSAMIPYFFGYKTEYFTFQNNPKNLDPSYKMDLDLWDCFGRVKLVL